MRIIKPKELREVREKQAQRINSSDPYFNVPFYTAYDLAVGSLGADKIAAIGFALQQLLSDSAPEATSTWLSTARSDSISRRL